jgi:ATP phosphoribosyltransferase
VRLGVVCDGEPLEAGLLDLLEAAGLPVAPLRSAVCPAFLQAGEVEWLLAGGSDVLAACESGAVDGAFVGKDVLLELAADVYELLDLRVGADDLVYATRDGGPEPLRPRVATRFPRTARRHFSAARHGVYVAPFTAAVLAPALGLATGVVELRARVVAAGLREREVVAHRSMRLVAGRAGRALHADALAALVTDLRARLEDM